MGPEGGPRMRARRIPPTDAVAVVGTNVGVHNGAVSEGVPDFVLQRLLLLLNGVRFAGLCFMRPCTAERLEAYLQRSVCVIVAARLPARFVACANVVMGKQRRTR